MLKNISNIVEKFINSLIIISTILIIGSVLLEVIFRYIIGRSLFWSNEFSILAYIWMTFLGMSILIKQDNLMQVDFISGFSQRIQQIIIIFKDIMIVTVLCLFIVVGFTSGLDIIAGQKLTATGIPTIWKYIITPIASVFGLFFLVANKFTSKGILKKKGEIDE